MFRRLKLNHSNTKKVLSSQENVTKETYIEINEALKENKQMIKETLGDSKDIFIREIKLHKNNNTQLSAIIVGIGGLVDEQAIRQQVVEPLLSEPLENKNDILNAVKTRIYVKDIKSENNLYHGILQILKGGTLILIDGCSTGLLIQAEGSAERAIEEPPTGTVVSGSREGFVEELDTNIALLRKRIGHPNLRVKSYTLGEFSQTDIIVAYVDGIVDPKIVEQMHKRIIQIEVDDISSSGQIEQYLSGNPYSIFPTTGNTERPDQLAAMLMEGRVALITDGTPVALYYPSLFLESLQSVEDYSSKPFYSSFTRLLRFLAFFLSILLPSLYICAVNIHKDMIPSKFLLALEQSREGVPFPLVQETILLLILFEIVREAGIRMPRAIGQAVSIVGALILGEVSVAAGIISSQTIIVVATASITTFIVTPVAEVVSLLRFLYIIPSAIFGFYGLMICILLTITHMVNLKSMGVYYLGPIMPVHLKDWKDTLIRLPYNLLKFRPKSIPNLRPIRYKKVPQTNNNKEDEE